MIIYAAIFWLIEMHIPDHLNPSMVLYFKKTEQSWEFTQERERATRYYEFAKASNERFRFLPRGVRFEILPYKSLPTTSRVTSMEKENE